MPILVILGVAAAYSGIGLAIRSRYFPREPVSTALIWPLVPIMAIGGKK